MNANKSQAKQIRKQKAEAEERRRDAIKKSIRRHNGTAHAFMAWGKKMSIFRAIHREIDPKIKTMRDAEDFLFKSLARHQHGKKLATA